MLTIEYSGQFQSRLIIYSPSCHFKPPFFHVTQNVFSTYKKVDGDYFSQDPVQTKIYFTV